MTTKQILDEQKREFDKSEYHNSDAVGSCEIGLTGAGECNCGIQELKKSIHSFSRKLIESVAEEIINLIPKYGDQYEIEAFRAEQRLKVKEIISEIGK